jgi:hypothetical protein
MEKCPVSEYGSWGCALPLRKIMEFIRWDDDIPNIWKQMFETTTQSRMSMIEMGNSHELTIKCMEKTKKQ